jgi:hypothetical protein
MCHTIVLQHSKTFRFSHYFSLHAVSKCLTQVKTVRLFLHNIYCFLLLPFCLPITEYDFPLHLLSFTWTSSMAVSASSRSTVFDSLALACAVDRRINVSRARAVTGWVRARSEFSKSWDRSLEYSSPISSQASSLRAENLK